MKKAIIVCAAIWSVIVTVILVGRFFSVYGLLTVILSFVVMTSALTGAEIYINVRLNRLFHLALFTKEYASCLDQLAKFASKFSLTGKESQFFMMIKETCLLYQGDIEQARAISDELPLSGLKPHKALLYQCSLRRDFFIVKADKKGYQEECQSQKLYIKKETELMKTSQRSDLFFFDLLDGFITREDETEVMNFLASQKDTAAIQELFYNYVIALIASLRHETLSNFEALVQKSEGTFLFEKMKALGPRLTNILSK